MTAFSVLNCFVRASVGNKENFNNENKDGESTSGGSSFFSPSVEQVVSAPYNFSFI